MHMTIAQFAEKSEKFTDASWFNPSAHNGIKLSVILYVSGADEYVDRAVKRILASVESGSCGNSHGYILCVQSTVLD